MKNILVLIGVVMLCSCPYIYASFQSMSHVVDNTFVSSQFSIPTPTPGTSLAGSVVINEINWAGSHLSTSDEWIELLNTLDVPVPIDGWTIDSLTVPIGKTIPAHGYFLISNSAQSASQIHIEPSWITTTVSLLDAGEELILRSSAGIVIDTANRNGGWYKGSKSPEYKSMERKSPPGNGADSANWQDASTHTGMDAGGSADEYGTPGSQNGI